MTLLLGDTLILDRWSWIRRRLPQSHKGASLLDVGCGSGAFTIGAAKRGYEALGLTYSQAECLTATARARICKAVSAQFQNVDVRKLDEVGQLKQNFDVVICAECIEHILNDEKLMKDIAGCLRQNGLLLLTTPNLALRPINAMDAGPVSSVEDGGHVRKGYSVDQLKDLAEKSGLSVIEISFCGGWTSQRLTQLFRFLRKVAGIQIAGLVLLPLRVLPLCCEPFLTRLLGWPFYTICLVARKEALRP